ncbi:MAG: FAD-binding protein [Planctomycetota bacterium]|nr:FAD-binding protein [Planctomycetota bacterium]
MPDPQSSGRPDRDTIARELLRLLPADAVLSSREECLVYECDGLVVDRARPDVVVLPSSTEEVAAVVLYASGAGVPFVARGAGTGLSGGCLALDGGIIISVARMDRILEIDPENRLAVVQPGVVNLDLSEAAREHGLIFAPDPSSQGCSTIGGNVAENAGGPHCLKYGQTSAHILALEVVLPDGRVVEIGSAIPGGPGYDLVGTFVGSEGTFGIATKITVNLMRRPEATETLLGIYRSVDEASQVVTSIIGARILPAALEMIDGPTMKAVEPHVRAGYPTSAGAALLIELEGPRPGMAAATARVRKICEEGGAMEVRVAKDDVERERLWAGRKNAFGAYGRLSPNFYVLDGVVPRTKLAEVIRRTDEVAKRHALKIAHVFHAGDGNLHPNILYDRRHPGEEERALAAADEIGRLCLEVGGSITGEHGIGFEKRDLMPLLFSEESLRGMKRLRGVFDPRGLCNPGKVFPTSRACGEITSRRILDVGWI